MKDNSFRNKASFGKRIEHYLIGQMLKEGLDVYIPMVDDDAVDAVVKRLDGKYAEIQIKARSKDVGKGNSELFAAINHTSRDNYWFVFYSERLNVMWILTSQEFLDKASRSTKAGSKNIGKYSIYLHKDSEFKASGFKKILG